MAALALAVSVVHMDSAPPAHAGAPRAWHVATTGQDRSVAWNPDGPDADFLPDTGDEVHPFGTIDYGIRQARASDTIYVHAGTYFQNAGGSSTGRGTASAPITLTPYPGDTVIIKGSLQFFNADYWIVKGFKIVRDPNKAPLAQLVRFGGGTGWRFIENEVAFSKGYAAVMVNQSPGGSSPHNYVIARNCIHDMVPAGHAFMNDHLIYLHPGYRSGPGLIERNILFTAANGNAIKAAGPNSSTGAADVTIRWNSMANVGQGVNVAYGSHHNLIKRNLIGPRRGGRSSYPAIRGYQLSGPGNVASDNAVFKFDRIIMNSGSSRPVRDGGGNRFVTPNMDSVGSCSGFHPANTVAQHYGANGTL